MGAILHPRQKLGKYRVEQQIATGGFAAVYRAFDTVEGTPVALKIPHARLVDDNVLEDFRNEVQLTARLDHPNILPIKNASFISGYFVIVSRLGERSLEQRLHRRLSVRTALDYSEQLLEAIAHAHQHKIIHCDVKPENMLLFHGDRLRLADFGIAKVAQHTVKASGSGTVGYIAPEQAMGKPSMRSDVFSAGLVIYRMLAGRLPEWPFNWPLPGSDRLKRKVPPEVVQWLRRAIHPEPQRRFDDADMMLRTYRRLKPRTLQYIGQQRKKRERTTGRPDWKEIRWRQFRRDFGAALEVRHECDQCHGPVAEVMTSCPWCGEERHEHHGDVRMPCSCPRCGRGAKLDWRFCAWCYGPAIGPASERSFSDVRYEGRCGCGGQLMPFMRYCPWCRRKVTRRSVLPGSRERCETCDGPVLRDYWNYCPWCDTSLEPA